jgi:DNA-binding beta-propeller fold protein YncE
MKLTRNVITARVILILLSLLFVREADAADCNRPAPQPITHIELPGNPFQAISTNDGCWIFVSVVGTKSEPGIIAVLKRDEGNVSIVRTVPVEGTPAGMVLTHDGNILIATVGESVAFLDSQRLISGSGSPVLGYWTGGTGNAGHFYANVTSNDEYLFVSDEGIRTVTVINLAAARASGFSNLTVGTIPVGVAPIALTFSPDERYLYTTSQVMPKDSDWPVECKPEFNQEAPPDHPQGAIVVVDVSLAKTQPLRSIVATVKAGCNPVRLVISPNGDVAYVTARGDHSLLAFDTKKLLSDPTHALIGNVRVGTAPVGVGVIEDGHKVVVTNSNRFLGGADDRQTVVVLDASKLAAGAAAILGTIPAGGFPREIRPTADKLTLLLTNFSSRTLELIDLQRLSLQPAGH